MLELKSAAKKAAKHAAKHAAKKAAAKKSAAKKSANPGKDTLRAYEHLGRVQALASIAGVDGETAKTLAGYAEQALRAGEAKDAAELLRAAEHHLFGTLAKAQAGDESLSPSLLQTVRDEVEHQTHKAAEHGACADAPRPILTIYKSMQKEATTALKSNRYRAALELSRGAEALTHAHFDMLLPAGSASQQQRLRK
jgi:hypothetical protein